MALFRSLTNVFKRVSSKTLAGADKEGNKFFTYEDPNGEYCLVMVIAVQKCASEN